MTLKFLSKWSILAALGITLSSALPLHAAGTIPLALAVQFDTQGNVAAGCLATFFQAGTIATKQNVYADFSLTQPLGNPLSCDQAGRLPMFWLADGLIHVRLTTSAGNQIVDTTMQVLGPSSGAGGGGGSTVDPTTVLATGDVKARYGTGPLSGFVRLNGLTIGNATSGASERANADTQSAFVYLCQTDPNLTVSGARSGNCLNDYNASKTITLPDMRGRVIAGLGDMGNSAASWLTSTYFGTSPTTLGAVSTTLDHVTLLTSNLPPYTPAGTVTANFPTTVTGHSPNNIFTPGGCCVGYGGGVSGGTPLDISGLSLPSGFSGTPQGGISAPFSSLPPTMVITFYMKL